MKKITLLISSLLLFACQTPPDIKALEDKNNQLVEQLRQANNKISQFETDKIVMQQEAAELNRLVAVLGQEKSSRVTESTNLRGEVRQYVQSLIDNLKQFLLASDLLDYVGGELVQRSNVDEAPLLLVDLARTVPFNGTLTGLGGFFQGAGTVSIRVLRPIAERLVVVWASQPITVTELGLQQLNLPVLVGVEKGDHLAYFLSQPGMISFDIGTGNTRYLDEDLPVGSSIKPSSLEGERARRAYSIGVYALLNSN